MRTGKRNPVVEERRSVLIFAALLVALIIIFSRLHEGFLTVDNFKILLKHNAINALTALGLTFVIAVGRFDLSFPWVGSLVGMTTSFFIANDLPVILSALIGLCVGLLCGLFNGVAVGRMKLPDMVTTIGSGQIAFGLGFIYSGGNSIYRNFLTSGILQLNDGELYGVPYPTIITVVVFLLAYFLLHRTIHGRRFYAVGNNQVNALFSGVNVRAYITAAYVICAGLTALATNFIIAAQGQGATRCGVTLLMPAAASVFLGIAVVGRATVLGTLLGALMLAIMLNGFTLLAVPFYSSDLIICAVLIIALSLSNENVRKVLRLRKPSGGAVSAGEVASR